MEKIAAIGRGENVLLMLRPPKQFLTRKMATKIMGAGGRYEEANDSAP
jgi:hypothetical protein